MQMWKEAKEKNQYFCLNQHICVVGIGRVDIHVINVLPCTHFFYFKHACSINIPRAAIGKWCLVVLTVHKPHGITGCIKGSQDYF